MLLPHIAGPDADIAESPFTVTAWALSPNTTARRARSLLRCNVLDHITDQGVLDDLDLMVSELATNAAVHADGPYEMRLLRHVGVPMICEIADNGGGLDVIADHLRPKAEQIVSIDALQTGGRGLAVVANLSGGRCGAHTTRLCSTGQPGKSVWFVIPA
jgi:anti-sigma regulatory factor (Ser/Thr protein kinase)